MGASEVHDLVVRARPEGVDETAGKLDGLSDSFEGAADEMEQSAGLLESFSDRFQGASGVIIAGLGTLAAGLLTQVPVIGEAVSGINAIIQSMVLQIDEQLRPAVGGLTAGLFGLADAINTVKGPLGTVVDFVAIFSATALGLLASVGVLAGAMAAASAAAGVLGVSLAAILVPIAVVSAAVAAMAIVWKENIFGIRDILTNFIEAVIKGQWIDAMGVMLTGAVSVTTQLIAVFDKLKATVQTIFEALGALVVSALMRLGNMAVGVLEDTVNRAIRAIPSEIRSELGINTVNLGTPFDPRSVADIRASAGRRLGERFGRIDRTQRARANAINQQLERGLEMLRSATVVHETNIDGETFARSVEPMLGEGAANSGANSRVR